MRGIARDGNLALVDHEAAHGHDIVGRHVAFEPDRQRIAHLGAAGDAAQVAEFLDEQRLILRIDRLQRNAQLRAAARGRCGCCHGRRCRCGCHRFHGRLARMGGLGGLRDDVLGHALVHHGRCRRSRRRIRRRGLRECAFEFGLAGIVVQRGERGRRNGGRRVRRGCHGSGRRRATRARCTARAAQQALELGADRGGGGRVGLRARAIVDQLVGQHVLGLEERVDHLRGQRDLVIARTVEQRFEDVRGVGQRREAERGRAALDRMRGAEDRREILGIGRARVEAEQQLLHLREQLVGLVEERLIELGDVESHAESTSGSSFMRRAGRAGLTKGSTPRARPRDRAACPVRAAFRSSRSRRRRARLP